MSDDDQNTIRISTDELSVEMSGSAARTQQAYMTLRQTLLNAYETTMADRFDGDDRTSGDEGGQEEGGNTQLMHEVGGDSEADPDPEQENMSAAVRTLAPDPDTHPAAVIKLVLHRDNYTKARLLERSELADSFLGQGLEASAIRRLYTNAETVEDLHDSLTIGDTLWRKLTPAGRREVTRKSQGDSEETNE